MVFSTFATIVGPPTPVSGMNIANLSAVVKHDSWHLGAYVTNLADKRVKLSPQGQNPAVGGGLDEGYIINQPREIDLRLGYTF